MMQKGSILHAVKRKCCPKDAKKQLLMHLINDDHLPFDHIPHYIEQLQFKKIKQLKFLQRNGKWDTNLRKCALPRTVLSHNSMNLRRDNNCSYVIGVIKRRKQTSVILKFQVFNLSFIDNKIYALENLLLRFSNNCRQIFNLKKRFLL